MPYSSYLPSHAVRRSESAAADAYEHLNFGRPIEALQQTDSISHASSAKDIQNDALNQLLMQGEFQLVVNYIEGLEGTDLRLSKQAAYALVWEYAEPKAKEALGKDDLENFIPYCEYGNQSGRSMEIDIYNHLTALLEDNEYHRFTSIKNRLNQWLLDNGMADEDGFIDQDMINEANLDNSDRVMISVQRDLYKMLQESISEALDDKDLQLVKALVAVAPERDELQDIGTFVNHLTQAGLAQASAAFRVVNRHQLKVSLCMVAITVFCRDENITTNAALEFLRPMLGRKYFSSQVQEITPRCLANGRGRNLLRGLLRENRLDDVSKATIQQGLNTRVTGVRRPRPQQNQNAGVGNFSAGMFTSRRNSGGAAAADDSNARAVKRPRL